MSPRKKYRQFYNFSIEKCINNRGFFVVAKRGYATVSGGVWLMNPHRFAYPMTVQCVLAHPEHPLSVLIVERGLLEGLRFFAQPHHIQRLRKRFSAELSVYPDAFAALDSITGEARFLLVGGEPLDVEIPDDAPCVVLSAAVSDMVPSPSTINVVVHNMLPPLVDSPEDRMFAAWRDHCINEEIPELSTERYHWCDRNDVASVVALMLKQDVVSGRFDLAGRRSWTAEETWEEFSHLMKRTQAGRTGRFDEEHLKVHGVPSVGVVPVTQALEERERPNLRPVHEFLMASTGEGWRPKTPLRHSLMFVIEGLERRQAR